MAIATLVVRLTADAAAFEKTMGSAAFTLQKTGKNLESIGSRLTQGITLPIIAIGGVAAKAAIDFESSFAGVRKTVDATAGEFKKLEGEFRNLAKTMPLSVNEINKVAESAGQLGIKKEAIVGFTETMVKLGATTNLTADEAATAMARLGNAMGNPTVDVGKLGAALVALGNDGASTEKEILDMAGRIAGAGAQIKLTEGSVLGISNALASVGIGAEKGGTAISRFFNDLNKAVSDGGSKLAAFAKVAQLSSADFSNLFKTDSAAAISKVIEGLNATKVAGSNLLPVLDSLGIKGALYRDTILLAANAGPAFARSIELGNKAFAEGKALNAEYTERLKTTASQLAILKNNLMDAAITFGQALLPALNDAVQAAKPFIAMLAGLAQSFADLPSPIRTTIIAIAGIAAAFGPVIFIAGKMVESFAAVAAGLKLLSASTGLSAIAQTSTAVGTLGTAAATGATRISLVTSALSLLLNPITLAVAGLGLLALVIYKVTTAETELEKAFQGNSTEFKQQTDSLERSLTVYTELSKKQNLTAEETRQLSAATSALATASGLSKDAFVEEAGKSAALTTELRNQIAARKDLRTEAITQARQGIADAEAALQRAKDQRQAVLSGQGVTFESSGVASVSRGMTAPERVAEITRLNGSVVALAGNVKKAQDAYEGLVGPLSAAQSSLIAQTLPIQNGWEGIAGLFTNGVTPAVKGVASAITTAGDSASTNAGKLALLRKELSSLSTADTADLVAGIKAGIFSVKELATQAGISENAVELLKRQMSTVGAADEDGIKKFTKSLITLEAQIQLAIVNGKPLSTLLDLFGEKAAESAEKASAWGVTVKAGVALVSSAFNQAALAKTFDKLNDGFTKFANARFERTFKRLQDDMHDSAIAIVEFHKALKELADDFEKFAQKRFERTFQKLTADMKSADQVAAELGNTFGKVFKRVGVSLVDDFAKGFQSGGLAGALVGVAGGAAEKFGGVFNEGVQRVLKDKLAGLDAALTFGEKAAGWGAVAAKSFVGGFQLGVQGASPGSAITALLSGFSAGLVLGPGGAVAGAGLSLAGYIVGVMDDEKRAAAALALQRSDLSRQFGGKEGLAKLFEKADINFTNKFLGKTTKLTHEQSVEILFNPKANTDQFNHAVSQMNDGLAEYEKRLKAVDVATAGVNTRTALFAKQFAPLIAAKTTAKEKGDTAGEAAAGQGLQELAQRTQPEFERLGTFVKATFAGIVKETGDAFAAIVSLAPSFQLLKAGISDFGLTSTGVIDSLLGSFDLINSEITGPFLANVQASGQILKGLFDAKALNAETFQALAADIGQSLQEVANRGGDMSKALALSAPVLQTLWEAQERYGGVTDQTTKSILDQAVQQGIVGAQFKSVNEKILDVLLAINKVLGGDLPAAFAALPGVAATAGAGIETGLGAGIQASGDNIQRVIADKLLNLPAGEAGDKMRQALTLQAEMAAKDMEAALAGSLKDLPAKAKTAASGISTELGKVRPPDIKIPDVEVRVKWKQDPLTNDWDLGPVDRDQIPAFATGAIVRKPTIALIGEAGPEAIIPLSQLGRGSISPLERGSISPLERTSISPLVRTTPRPQVTFERELQVKGIDTAAAGVTVAFGDAFAAVSAMAADAAHTFALAMAGSLQTLPTAAETAATGIATALGDLQPPTITIPATVTVEDVAPITVGVQMDWRTDPRTKDFDFGAIDRNRLPHLATGGIVRRRTLALVGEDGPEAVVPLSRLASVPASSGSREPSRVTFNVTINGPVDSEERARQMVRDFARQVKLGGESRTMVLESLGVD